MDLLHPTFKREGWIMMRWESFLALIKQPQCIKVSLPMAGGWNRIVFNISSNSNHPTVPWSSPLHSSWDTERILWRFDAHQKGIFHHQVWADFSHPRSFFNCLNSTFAECPKCSKSGSGFTLFWEDTIPIYSMVWLHLWFPLSKGNKQAFKPSSKSPSQSQGRPSAMADTNLWQEFAAQLLHKAFSRQTCRQDFHQDFLIFLSQAC